MKALCFKLGSFSLVNENLVATLATEMPGVTFRWLDLQTDFLDRLGLWKFLLIAETILRFPRQTLRQGISPAFLISRCRLFPSRFQRWKETVYRETQPDFSLQTQSLFDASLDRPHMVYTDHTFLANRRYQRVVAALPSSPEWLAMEAGLYRAAACNFVSSEFAASSLRDDYGVPATRARCILSGTNVAAPPTLAPTRHSSGRILFIGVQWERKGGPELLEAFHVLREEFPRAELHIVGCDVSSPGPHVVVHGLIPASEVPRHLLAADIFCLPSLSEPSAVALVEAAAFGLPVVATRVGGNAERLVDGETGLLVEPKNVPQLTEALRTLLRDRQRAREMGARGRIFVGQHFTWTAVARKMAAGIRETLEATK